MESNGALEFYVWRHSRQLALDFMLPTEISGTMSSSTSPRFFGPFRRVLSLGVLFGLLQPKVHSQMPSSFEFTVPRKLSHKDAAELTVSYAIFADEHQYIVNLTANRALLSADFIVFSYRDKDHIVKEPVQIELDCYYQGTVVGIKASIVSLSVCSGLTGFLQIKMLNYRIEPVDITSMFQHLIYKVRDVDQKPDKCTANLPNKTHPYKLKHASYKPLADLESRRYLEAYIVVDNAGYRAFHSNTTIVANKVVELINLADAMFAPLNLQIVLTGVEIWSEGDVVSFSNTTKQMVHEFSMWNEKQFKPQISFDFIYLFTSKLELEEDMHANLGTICSGAGLAAGILVFHAHHLISEIAISFAHAVGHNIGIRHDEEQNEACRCPSGRCIMGLYKPRKVAWSDCSISDYKEFLANDGGVCLQNVPSVESLVTISYCGNKKVEEGEQCDCGSHYECAADSCCDSTCKFKNGAQCSTGGCCKECTLLKRGTPCRQPVSECDLAEYCNGVSNLCPEDVHSQDGTPCNNNKSYCVNKKCYDYTKHCKVLFGEDAIVARHECFVRVNSQGRRFGNCGFKTESALQKCEEGNVMCGRVQCENITKMLIYPKNTIIHQIPVGTRWCWTLTTDYDHKVPDIGAVDDGAICGIGRVCINRTCLPLSDLSFNCDEGTKCSGHGVCNSHNNCHCDKDWAPPNCKYFGFGGSIDSGPLINGSFISYIPSARERMYGIVSGVSVVLAKEIHRTLFSLFLTLHLYCIATH